MADSEKFEYTTPPEYSEETITAVPVYDESRFKTYQVENNPQTGTVLQDDVDDGGWVIS